MAQVGELEPWFNRKTNRQEWRLVLPAHCRNGHQLVPDVIHLTHRGCRCRDKGGHVVAMCMTCGDAQDVTECLEPAEGEVLGQPQEQGEHPEP